MSVAPSVRVCMCARARVFPPPIAKRVQESLDINSVSGRLSEILTFCLLLIISRACLQKVGVSMRRLLSPPLTVFIKNHLAKFWRRVSVKALLRFGSRRFTTEVKI